MNYSCCLYIIAVLYVLLKRRTPTLTAQLSSQLELFLFARSKRKKKHLYNTKKKCIWRTDKYVHNFPFTDVVAGSFRRNLNFYATKKNRFEGNCPNILFLSHLHFRRKNTFHIDRSWGINKQSFRFLNFFRPFLRKNRFISVIFPKNTKNKVTKRKKKCFPFFLDVSDEKKINKDMLQYALKD